MGLKFRTFNASEIECKAVVVKNAVEISLHGKAATFTRILNETVGPLDWEKEYTNGNKNCIVRIWDNSKARFISKEDCGGPLTEVDGHKGQASNGFKRVCALGWGLGIELYSQPSILFPKTDANTIYDDKNGYIVTEQYFVKEIEYDEDKKITRCVIARADGTIVYDGPDERGESRIAYPKDEPETVLVIPEDADMNTDTVDISEDELPDNTDGYEDNNPFSSRPAPFEAIDYRKEIEAEIHRTHVKRADVLNALKVNSFEELSFVSDSDLELTLNKLRALPTYKK